MWAVWWRSSRNTYTDTQKLKSEPAHTPYELSAKCFFHFNAVCEYSLFVIPCFNESYVICALLCHSSSLCSSARACSERTNDYTSRYNGAHTDRPAVVPITYWKNIEARSVISYCCSFLDNIITYVTISSWDVTLNRSIFFNLKLVFNVTKCRRVSDTYTRYTPYRIQVPNLKTNYVYDTYWDMKCIIYFWLSCNEWVLSEKAPNYNVL